MNRLILLGLGALALAGCTTQVPDSGQGVGFSDYTQYELERAQREAQLRGQGAQTAPQPATVAPAQGGISTAELRAAGIDNTADTDRTAGVQATPGNTAPALASNPGISDEQDFEAVSARESIESDAERLERQAAAYTVIEPTALPDRPGSTGPNIVQFALNAPNDKGQQIYARGGISGQARFQRNCAKYNNPDEAQRDFLSRGGPERDRLGIDPDGDGFACGWDPSPFRRLADGN